MGRAREGVCASPAQVGDAPPEGAPGDCAKRLGPVSISPVASCRFQPLPFDQVRRQRCLRTDCAGHDRAIRNTPTRVLRVMRLLNELALEYEMVPVDLMQGEAQQPDFLALNPAAKVPVPVLVDGSLMLTESAAIQLYPGRQASRERYVR